MWNTLYTKHNEVNSVNLYLNTIVCSFKDYCLPGRQFIYSFNAICWTLSELYPFLCLQIQ